MFRLLPATLASLILTAAAQPAFAWGERGHNAIARIAARLVAQNKDPEIAAFGAVLQRREHMLGHLANVPDIVWRSAGPEVEAANTPSHFIDLDYILPASQKLSPQQCPITVEAYQKALAANCQDKKLACAPGSDPAAQLAKAGHAPFRIQNLSGELSAKFSELKKLEADPKATAEARKSVIDGALLYAGVMAHFVGDLANPHHTSSDYDGWESEQGGLHKFFESDSVDAQKLGLEQEVLTAAGKVHPAQQLFGAKPKDALLMAWQLALASHERLPALLELDRKNSLLHKSNSQLRKKAERKAPEQAADAYHAFIIERLSVGADALAAFWISAWEAAGRPKLQGYESYYYPVKPDFIPLGYTPVSQAAKP